ncbi:hypothetical protein PILCRDRAFT_414642 [Piloderma croceum F 1598]|uniref:Uncharacterized protein n=1 Tax=Piloderma croceum (strain F 1598) TaxID=765440 RepID=A0A0C3BBY7_PILCF|nr:hypothetical protein PILCRDRAFT_414642 [Piloderma croceum F 1598]
MIISPSNIIIIGPHRIPRFFPRHTLPIINRLHIVEIAGPVYMVLISPRHEVRSMPVDLGRSELGPKRSQFYATIETPDLLHHGVFQMKKTKELKFLDCLYILAFCSARFTDTCTALSYSATTQESTLVYCLAKYRSAFSLRYLIN